MLSSRARIVAALLALVVAVVALGGAPAAPARAAVASCSNGACPDPTSWATERWKPHAGYPSHGGTVDGANCTNYVAWRLIKTLGMTETAVRGLGNASTWDTRAADKGYRVDRVATAGAVAQWDNNHVAYVEQVNGDGTIVISESNVWSGTPSNRMWLRHRVISASSVDHFIHFVGADALSPRTVMAPGDLSGDGIPDLVSIRVDGVFKIFEGDGAGGVVDPAGRQVGTGWSSFRFVMSPGDFSGDGKPDLLTVGADGRLFLYRGDGAGGFPGSRVQLGSGWNKMRTMFSPGDFNKDGFSDVFAVRSDGKLLLYTGNGRGGFTGKTYTLGLGFHTAKLVGSPGDFDGDGRADVVAVSTDGTVKLYRGPGTKGRIDRSPIVIATGWTDATAFAGRGDVTGDSMTDVFAVRAGALVRFDGDGSVLSTGTPLGVTW